MRFLKVFLCMLLILGLIFSLAGCFLSGNVKVDKDGNVVIKDKDSDGNEVVIGEKKWDKSKMHGLEAPIAKIESSIITDEGTMYGFVEMKEKDAKEYIENIKSAGFTYSSVTFDDYTYFAINKEGLTISFTYDKESESGGITSGKGEPPSEEDSGDGAVVGGSDMKWDSTIMGGLPDPGVKINSFWKTDGAVYYNLDVIPSYTDYVETIKACGFTENIQESDINDVYLYIASNTGGDIITFSVSTDMSSFVFEKME